MEDSTMFLPNHEAVEFLLSRRSRPAKTLLGPGPTDKELKTLLTAAARTPDHGKLEPWRFIVFQRDAFSRLVNLIVKRGNELELEPEKINKTCVALKTGAVMIAVVYSPKQSKKIPEIAKGLGKMMREVKDASNEIKREIKDSTKDIKDNIDNEING